ncbi:type II toxin-antitoxin system RelE family toxin [Neorhodopirellula lusitana]|uniref:type II toxin-antitoxin system RelE family toxin n=1 Tax=Neorhodopirellula lusitana TaxID=445327 RepID=UPI00384C9596
MNHFAGPAFWECYKKLPDAIRALADKNFALLKGNPNHPSLHFKKVGRYRSARVGRDFRALAVETDDGLLWFWIGHHAEYDRLIGA